jgi:hypothetical protein
MGASSALRTEMQQRDRLIGLGTSMLEREGGYRRGRNLMCKEHGQCVYYESSASALHTRGYRLERHMAMRLCTISKAYSIQHTLWDARPFRYNLQYLWQAFRNVASWLVLYNACCIIYHYRHYVFPHGGDISMSPSPTTPYTPHKPSERPHPAPKSS